jgi:energy-coupling factor transporter transmembrane protein EcfT
MRFEPPEYSTPDEDARKEMPLFRVVISHHPAFLYLFMCTVFVCAYSFATAKMPGNSNAALLLFFLYGWALSLVLFLFAFLMFVYARIEVSTRTVSGHRISLLHHHFKTDLSDITSVTVSQYFFAGPLHYGRLRIRTPLMTIHIPFVREPEAVKKALDRAVCQAIINTSGAQEKRA